MIRIGLFSAITRVPAKTLRYYDEIGLLKPHGQDKSNAYRLYEVSQIKDVYRIQVYKRMGFRLETIRELLEGEFKGEEIQNLFKTQRSEILEKISRLQSQLNVLDQFDLASDSGESTVSLVDFKELESQNVILFPVMLKQYDDQTAYWLEFHKLTAAYTSYIIGPHFCRYVDGEYRSRDIGVELCLPVLRNPGVGKPLIFKKLDSEKLAACLLHEGSYTKLSLSYSKLLETLQLNRLEMEGFPREVYLQAADRFPEDEYLTEIQIPVREIKNDEKSDRAAA